MQVLRERCYRAFNRIIPCDVTQVLTLSLAQALRPKSDINGCEFDYLTASQVREFSKDTNSELKPEMAALIESDEARCYAITHGNALAAYTWVATGDIAPKHNCGGSRFLGIGFQLPDNVAYIFKVLVLPAYRGKQLNGWMLYKLGNELSDTSIDTFITTTDWTNYPFLSSAAKSGFKPISLAGEFIVGSRHIYKLPNVGISGLLLVGGGRRKI